MVSRCPALFAQIAALKPEQFSSSLLGRVYNQLRDRCAKGLEVSTAVLEGLQPEEMSHVTGILHRHQGPVNESALLDCARTIAAEYDKRRVSSADDLLALRNQMKERKGIHQ